MVYWYKYRHALILTLAILVYFIFFSLIAVWKYYNFSYNALDLAIINQAFFNSSQGQLFASSIHPSSYLGDHFSPILLLLLPLYSLIKSPLTLLLVQTLVSALSTWPIYLIAKQLLTKNWALFIALAWLLNPVVQNSNLFEFHFLHLAVFFLFWTIYWYQQKNWLGFLIFTALALLVREDVGLVILGFSLLAIIDKRNWRWTIVPLALALGYLFFATYLINLYAPAGQNKFLVYYSWLGASWLDMVKNFFFQPQLITQHLLKLGNLEFILGLLLIFAFLPLLALRYVLLGLFIFLQLVFTADGASASMLQMHYANLLLPGLVTATIFSLKKIISQLTSTNQSDQLVIFIRQNKNLAGFILALTVIYTMLTLGPLPGVAAKLATDGLIWPTTASKQFWLKTIPTAAAVATTYDFLPRLSSRQNVYSFNYVFLNKQQYLTSDYKLPDQTQYLLIDFTDLISYQLQYNNRPFYQKQYDLAVNNLPKNLQNFGLISLNDTVALYKKNAIGDFQPVNILTAEPKISQQQKIDLNNQITFLGYNQPQLNNFQLFFAATKKITKNYQLELTFQSLKTKQNYKKIYPLAYGLLPTSLWPTDKIVQINYWLDPKLKNQLATYQLSFQLVDLGTGGLEIDPIGSTKQVIDFTTPLGQPISLGLVEL